MGHLRSAEVRGKQILTDWYAEQAGQVIAKHILNKEEVAERVKISLKRNRFQGVPQAFLIKAGHVADKALQEAGVQSLAFDSAASEKSSKTLSSDGCGYGNPPRSVWREDQLSFIFTYGAMIKNLFSLEPPDTWERPLEEAA